MAINKKKKKTTAIVGKDGRCCRERRNPPSRLVGM
jgi:hypothetical protein